MRVLNRAATWLRIVAAVVMLASAGVAFVTARSAALVNQQMSGRPPAVVHINDLGRGGHYLYWLLWREVHEVRAGRGDPAWGQILLEAAAREVDAGRADERLTDLVRQARRGQ